MKRKHENIVHWVVIIILAIFVVLISRVETNAQNTGYLVVIDKGLSKSTVRKCRTIEQLEKVVKQYYPKSDINISEFMKGSVFFEVRRYDFIFYVEMKRVNKKGKFRKLSKKEIKQIESGLK